MIKIPVQKGKDSKGKYYRWGTRGKKYYYTNEMSEAIAKNKARRQGRAIKSKQ